jgi:hypothetical protein
VVESVQDQLPQPVKVADEGRLAVDDTPDRQEVHAMAHEIDDAGGRLARHREADHEVGLPGQAAEEHVEGGQEHREERTPPGRAQAAQLASQGLRQDQALLRGRVRLHGRPWPVRG